MQSSSDYVEMSVELFTKDLEPVSDLFTALGALALTESDAGGEEIIEPSPTEEIGWQHTCLTALFAGDENLESVLLTLSQHYPLLRPTIRYVQNQNWVTAWQKDFKPICFGERLWVCPSWLPCPHPDATNVMLDPGVAFGTGTHPTTALCLKWLDAHVSNQSTLVDYGCGSGILAIAAVKLGAKTAIGVDYDPQAIESSRANAQKNKISAEQFICYLPEDCPQGLKADIVIANIVANPLIQLAPRLCELLKDDGQLVLSGILESQVDTVIAAYAPWLTLTLTESKEEWVLLSGKKVAM
jgi:ribosomal protein L11 methyltransferase